MTDKETDETKIAVLVEKVGALTLTVNKMDLKFDQLINQFVTKAEFQPVKQIVYGLVGLILMAVVGGLLTLVINK